MDIKSEIDIHYKTISNFDVNQISEMDKNLLPCMEIKSDIHVKDEPFEESIIDKVSDQQKNLVPCMEIKSDVDVKDEPFEELINDKFSDQEKNLLPCMEIKSDVDVKDEPFEELINDKVSDEEKNLLTCMGIKSDVHVKDEPFEESIIDKVSDQEKSLDETEIEHLKSDEPSKDKQSCSMLIKKRKLRKSSHNSRKIFKCLECSYETSKKTKLKYHKLIHSRKKLSKTPESSCECHQKVTDFEIDKELNMNYKLEKESDPEDNLELEEMYDSGSDFEYVPSVPSDDCASEDEICKGIKRQRISSPTRIRALSQIPSTCSAIDEPIQASSTIPLPHAATPMPALTDNDSKSSKRKRYSKKTQEYVSSIVDFHTLTISTNSGFRWNCRPQSNFSTRRDNRNVIPHCTPGPTAQAKNCTTPLECLRLFFDDNIVTEIVNCTNQKIRYLTQNAPKERNAYSETSTGEVLALLGLLAFSGCQKDNHLTTREMWSPITGTPLYRSAMSEERFTFLIGALRFDNMDTRQERQKNDKFAPIRSIWDVFVDNCGKMYTPHENLTVDEQLLAFRGKCPFKIYIPNKPAKYGIKLVLINDNTSKYLLGAIPYLGKLGTPIPNNQSLGHHFTKELTKPYHQTNRNVTTDNWFTSVPLALDLLTNCGMTIVGTIRGNKKEVPIEMKEKQKRKFGSSAFLFTKEMTLLSYVPTTSRNKKKIVLLLSTVHTNPVITPSGKPEIIEFYNKTKGGVNTFDQMCSNNACGRKTRRWPLCVFFGMINAALINSFIIHTENMIHTNKNTMNIRNFIHELALTLIRPWAEQRAANSNGFSRSLQIAISNVINIPFTDTKHHLKSLKDLETGRIRCTSCPINKNRLSQHRCQICKESKCFAHLCGVCFTCAK